jgi:small basic protein
MAGGPDLRSVAAVIEVREPGYAAAPAPLSRAGRIDVPFGTVRSRLGGEIGYCVLVGLFAFAVTLAVRGTAAGAGLTLGVVLLLRVVFAVLDLVAWPAVPAVPGARALIRRDA